MLNQKEKTNIKPIPIAIFYIFDKVIAAIGIILLARLLEPSDFGIAGLALVFISIIAVGKFSIFHSALIYEREEKNNIYAAGFTADLIASLFLYISLFVIAPLLANFYKIPALTPLIRVGSSVILMDSFRVVPVAKLEKKLRFNIIYGIFLVGAFSKMTLSIIFALMGFSFWSILWAYVISEFISILLFNFSESNEITLNINQAIIAHLLAYGKYILVINVTWLILKQISELFIGKIIGVISLGYFLIAYKLAYLALNNILTPLDRMLFPAYARHRGNNVILKEIFLKTLRYSSIPAFFISIGLFMIADEFVNGVLGTKWDAIITPLKILCFAGLIQFIGYLSNACLRGGGYIKTESTRYIFNIALLLFLLYPLITAYGINGACVAILLATALTQVLYVTYTIKKMKIAIKELFNTIRPPIISAFLMATILHISKKIIPESMANDFLSLILLFSIELFVYLGTIMLLLRKDLVRIFHSLKYGLSFELP